MTDQTQEPQANEAALQAEVERLRNHSAELLADLKTERQARKTAEEALQAASGKDGGWKERFHKSHVLDPLKRELSEAAAVPSEYLQAICTNYRWLETEVDSESPTLAELADATNWQRVADRKQIPLSFLKHKL